MTKFKEGERWLQSDKLEEKILDLIMKSDLGYWETLGMLEHMKMEFHRLGAMALKQKKEFEDE